MGLFSAIWFYLWYEFLDGDFIDIPRWDFVLRFLLSWGGDVCWLVLFLLLEFWVLDLLLLIELP